MTELISSVCSICKQQSDSNVCKSCTNDAVEYKLNNIRTTKRNFFIVKRINGVWRADTAETQLFIEQLRFEHEKFMMAIWAILNKNLIHTKECKRKRDEKCDCLEIARDIIGKELKPFDDFKMP